MADICRDKYVCYMKDINNPKIIVNCYCTATYNRSRSGNTMNYSGSFGLYMNSNNAYSYYRWIVNLRAGNITLLSNYEIKGNHGNSNIWFGKKLWTANWNFSINTNTDATPFYFDWYDKNENYTLMAVNNSNTHIGYVYPITPSAPNAPTYIGMPGTTAPDRTVTISWSGASGGTNGVSGYYYQYSKNGGSTWEGGTITTSSSCSLNLNNLGFTHGSTLRFRVLAYSTVNGQNYDSSWATSGNVSIVFSSPGNPGSLSLICNNTEPIPSAKFTASWSVPSNRGTNGVSGYRIQWLKNGNNYGNEYDVSGTSTSITLNNIDYQPGDVISFKVRCYTIGQNARYYSGYTTSGSITIVSDKYLYVSQNGGDFIKYKLYVSQNGGDFKEIRKEKFKLI